jgi:U3 small nucleolar RNA-associated protein 4
VICWAGSRLFSVGLDGDGLKEWDLATLTPKRRLLLTGERGICMDYHQEKGILAVGTEEGIMNIFDVSDDDLQFVRLLDRQDHRIICCKFNESGDKIVSGSLDAVKIWNVQTGQVIHKMSMGRAEPNQETIVWCVDILSDFTIATGDSRGKVTFWDGNLGTQIDYVHASTADIMCLSVSDDRKSFFCSGLEQILKKYSLVTITKAGSEVQQWVRSAKRSKIHTHDILSMATVGNEQLISGGVDGFISFASQDFQNFERAGPFLKRPFADTAEGGRLMLMKYVDYLEVWKLAGATELSHEEKEDDSDKPFSDNDDVLKTAVNAKNTNKQFKINDFPEKFLELRSKNDESIVCCAISDDGRWVAYSTMNSARLFRFEVQENSKPKLKVIKSMPSEFAPSTNMMFSKDSNTLITVKSNGRCSVFDLEVETFEHKDTFDISEHHTDMIHLSVVSSCSKYLVLSSLCNNITIWNLKKNKWMFAKSLPKYACPATSLKIRKNQPVLVVSFSDNKILEYNLDGHFIQFSTILPSKSSSVDSVITNICLDPRNADAIIFCRNNSIQVLEKNGGEKVSGKKAKVVQKTEGQHSVKVVKTFNSVRFSQFFYQFQVSYKFLIFLALDSS